MAPGRCDCPFPAGPASLRHPARNGNRERLTLFDDLLHALPRQSCGGGYVLERFARFASKHDRLSQLDARLGSLPGCSLHSAKIVLCHSGHVSTGT